MIAIQEYDSDAAKSRKVKFKTVTNIEKHIEKYLLAFDAINRRISHMGEFHKYERICLLIVDFNRKVPKVYSDDNELIKDKLLPQNSKSSIKNLSFETFITELLKIYSSRFWTDKFNWYLVIKNSSISSLFSNFLNSFISLSLNIGMLNFSIKFFW